LVGIMLVTAPSSALIRSTGSYDSPSGSWTLEVFRGEGSLIQYKIMDQNLDSVFGPEIDFSDVHRWAFFWESDSTLWCHTSDIGTSVWTLMECGLSTGWKEIRSTSKRYPKYCLNTCLLLPKGDGGGLV
jgi:hypothetical protein